MAIAVTAVALGAGQVTASPAEPDRHVSETLLYFLSEGGVWPFDWFGIIVLVFVGCSWLKRILKQLMEETREIRTQLMEETREIRTQLMEETREIHTQLMEETRETHTQLMEETRETRRQLATVREELQPFLAAVNDCISIWPIPYTDASVSDASTWHSKVVRHYGGQNACMVLSQLFPCLCARGASHREAHTEFPAVAEHVYPKNKLGAELARIDVHNPKNSLLLLRQLELHYQAGHLAFIPHQLTGETVTLKIFVHDVIMSDEIAHLDNQRRVIKKVVVCGGRGHSRSRTVTYQDLHEKTFSVTPVPSLRALFLKADMAHRHLGMPPPPWRNASFHSKCAGLDELLRRLLQSKPDPQLRVTEEVNDALPEAAEPAEPAEPAESVSREGGACLAQHREQAQHREHPEHREGELRRRRARGTAARGN